MYPTSDTYKEKVKELDRTWETKVDIEHEKGTLHLTDKDIALGGMSVTEKTQPGEDFGIGGTVASDLSLKILNRTGGGNLLKNKDYSQDNEYQTIVKTNESFEGQPIYKATKKKKGTPATPLATIDIRKGETYTASIWTKTEQDAEVFLSMLSFYKNYHRALVHGTRIGEWERLIVTYTNDSEEDLKDVSVYYYPANGEGGEVTYFTCPKLEKGDQATPWEDDYSDIDFTGAKIKPYVMLTEDDEGRNLLKRTTDKYQSIDTGTWFNRLNEYPKALNPIEDFGLQVGDTIVYRLYLKTNVDVGAVARLTFYSDDNYSDKTTITGNVISENSEGYSSVVVTLTEKMKYIDVNIQNGKAGEINSNIVEYKKPKLEKGDTATDWRPAVEDWSEPIPLGIFNVDTQSRFRSTIELKAMDNMIKMDRPYSYSKLSYPATLYQIYVDVCSTCNLLPATHNFLHKDLLIKNRPEGDLSCRDILGFVAQLSGSFAKITRDGKVALKWYEPTGLELGPMNRDDFKPSDEEINITGIMFKESDEKTYLVGTDDYAIDLTENPLLQQDYSKVLPAILNKIKEIKFNPYTVSKWQGNPAIEAGDMVRHIDVDGNVFDTIITSSTYRYGMKGSMEAKAKSEVNKGYKGSTSKKLANVVQKIENNRVEVEDKLTSVEQAQLNAMQLMANMLGGHAIVEGDAFYIADNVDLSKAKKVWKWGMGGFAYYPDGLNNPPSTAVTADNSIVAMLVAAHIITADMVRTGILQSEDGNTWINLNNSQFNFANMITWDGKEFKINFNKAGLAVGVANLVRRSKDRKVSSSYLVGTYNITEDWETNTTYSITIKGNINNGQEFGIWANGPGMQVATLKYDKATGLHKATFTTPSTIDNREPKTLRVYNYPSSGATNAAIDWIKLEKGSVNTGWTPAEGELEGVSYSFTGDAAILKGAGFIILNNNSVPVMQGDAQGNLSMTGDFITYNNGQKALEMVNNELRLHDWQGTTRVDPVGQLYAARREYDANKPGFSIANRKNAYLALTYRKDSAYYAYIDFDKDNVLGNSQDYPIVFWERPLFRNPARFDGTVYFGGQRHKIFNATKGALVIEVNDGDTTRGFTLQGDTQGSKVLEFRPWWKEEIALWRNTLISGNLSVTGSKNSLQETKHYGQRLLNALETAEYYFADFGFGKIGEDGKCYIYIDDIFNETVNTEVEYHVIYGKYGENENSKIITKERHKNYFVAKGTPGLEFSWFLVVKRKGYEHNRLEQPDNLNLERDDSVSFDRDFEQEDKEDKELERIYDDKLSFDLVSLLLEEAV
ncbi:hypothetical protein NSA23_03520 [Anaerosalibacter massiliensis]|uniref:Prophage endopeptidase tail n=1 Tax=Anaerosalibacter massiliensis TaxID=1347392 RepID=A0A9X2MGL7_9FIRM|nr:hypothetical protein [Anaerosalibacter massiliensis]MCR2043181.1 hypothetical protein [Anaerosalibacter massiliensis]